MTFMTPENLRIVADSISCIHESDPRNFRFIYMCNSVCEFFGEEAGTEFQMLCKNLGVTDLTGMLFDPFMENYNEYYEKNAPAVRFMLLEFAALYLEDQQ